MHILIFDISGKFAHFRKYYTNSSSLTYSVPPRTTVIGLMAAILGFERDSYYEKYTRENTRIAIKKLSKNRRIMQTLNYIKADTMGKLVTPKDHTQIPFEILTSDRNVRYRIYLSIDDEKDFEQLENRIKNKKYVYAPFMGAAPFNCKIDFINATDELSKLKNEFAYIDTVVNINNIEPSSIQINEESTLLREKMPSNFGKDRVIKAVDSYIFDEKGSKIKMKVKSDAYKINYRINNEKITENIVFM